MIRDQIAAKALFGNIGLTAADAEETSLMHPNKLVLRATGNAETQKETCLFCSLRKRLRGWHVLQLARRQNGPSSQEKGGQALSATQADQMVASFVASGGANVREGWGMSQNISLDARLRPLYSEPLPQKVLSVFGPPA